MAKLDLEGWSIKLQKQIIQHFPQSLQGPPLPAVQHSQPDSHLILQTPDTWAHLLHEVG